jgi:hypothetical protein
MKLDVTMGCIRSILLIFGSDTQRIGTAKESGVRRVFGRPISELLANPDLDPAARPDHPKIVLYAPVTKGNLPPARVASLTKDRLPTYLNFGCTLVSARTERRPEAALRRQP